jgi:Putative transposase
MIRILRRGFFPAHLAGDELPARGCQRTSQSYLCAVCRRCLSSRTSSTNALNVHFHALALDGVYMRDACSAELRFMAMAPPTLEQIHEVARRTEARVRVLLRNSGRYFDDEQADTQDPAAHSGEQQVLLSCYQAAAAAGLELLGARAGQPTLRLVHPPLPQSSRGIELCADFRGVNVHAMVAFDGRDRPRLLRLCRYIARPPLAQERLTQLPDGRLQYVMKKRWRDGTLALIFDALSLIGRLIALIPPPRFHMLRFHGVLAPHAAARSAVVPKPNPPPQTLAQLPLPYSASTREHNPRGAVHDEVQQPPSRHPWAVLLKHVFAVDVTVCVKCAGTMRLVDFATTPRAIARALARVGLRP